MLKNLLNNLVFKNFSYLTISTVIAQLLSLVTILKITSILSPENYGLYTFLITQGALLIKIGDLGNRNIVIRTIAREPENTKDIVVNGALLRIMAVTFLFALYLLYNYKFGELSGIGLTLIYVYSLVICLSDLFELVFHGNQKMLPSSIINLIYSIGWLAIVFILLDFDFDVESIFILYIGISSLKTIVYFGVLKYYKLLLGEVRPFLVSSRGMIMESWPYLLLILIMLPLTSLSNNFLDINSTNQEIGYFNLSQRLIGPISLVITMSLSAIFPNLSALWTSNNEKFHQYLSSGFGFFILISMIFCLLFSLFAKEVVGLLFPDSYLPAVAVCKIQVWYLFLTSVDSLIGVVLGAANREKIILGYGVLYFIVCTPVLYFSSKYGAVGLAYGYITSYGLCLIYVWFSFKKTLGMKINHEILVWTFAILAFILSIAIPNETTFLLKLLLTFLILGVVSFYFIRNFRLLKIR